MTKKPPLEDPIQSRRFLETAKELEDAGDLDHEKGEATLDRLVTAAKANRPSQDPEKE